MAEKRQNTLDVFTPLGGRGRGLYRVEGNTGARPKLLTKIQKFPSSVLLPEVSLCPKLAQPACSTPSDSNNNVTQQLIDLIGELGSQIGKSIAGRLLVSQNVVNTTPTTTIRLDQPSTLATCKLSFIVRTDIKEPPMFKGDESDKYRVKEWIDVMELYLQKISCPEAEKASTILSYLLGRAKNIIKVGLKSTGSVSTEKINDMLRHYFTDHLVSPFAIGRFLRH